jgi:apolipoprotein D and lipocalin family protein
MSISFFSCKSSDTKLQVVGSVDVNRYAGTWYEIARLPASFEKGLKCTSATYVLREDGRIVVINKGRKISDPSNVKEAKGIAWIPDKNQPGKLKVRFFWPFTGDYWILFLDPDYRFVMVGAPDLKYLWILSRTRQMDEPDFLMLTGMAKEMGFDLSPLIRVRQDCD